MLLNINNRRSEKNNNKWNFRFFSACILRQEFVFFPVFVLHSKRQTGLAIRVPVRFTLLMAYGGIGIDIKCNFRSCSCCFYARHRNKFRFSEQQPQQPQKKQSIDIFNSCNLSHQKSSINKHTRTLVASSCVLSFTCSLCFGRCCVCNFLHRLCVVDFWFEIVFSDSIKIIYLLFI